MLYLWSILLILLNALWLVLVVFGLPGNWLIVISACLFAWWRAEDNIFSIYTLIAVVALAVLGELIEFFAGAGGAKRAGAGPSKSSHLRLSFGGQAGQVYKGQFRKKLPFTFAQTFCLTRINEEFTI